MRHFFTSPFFRELSEVARPLKNEPPFSSDSPSGFVLPGEAFTEVTINIYIGFGRLSDPGDS